MVNYDVANSRISGFSTFLGGLSMIALILSVNIFSNRAREPSPLLLGAETLTVLFFLAAMVVLFSSTVVLVSSYTDAGRELASSVKLARQFIGSGAVLMFLGVSGLLLVAFDLTEQAYVYSLAAVVAAAAFAILRARLGRVDHSGTGPPAG